jgi:hypothetical protein
MVNPRRGGTDIAPKYPRFTKMRGIRNTADVSGGKAVAVSPQYVSGVITIYDLLHYLLLRIYEIHGRKGKVLFFSSFPDSTRDNKHGIIHGCNKTNLVVIFKTVIV